MRELTLKDELLKIKIGDVVLETDADDIETLERFEAFRADIERVSTEMQNSKNYMNGIRELCEVVAEGIDNIFGEGSAKKVFGNSVNFKKCTTVGGFIMDSFTEHYNKTAVEMKRKVQPANREQRRQAERNNKKKNG